MLNKGAVWVSKTTAAKILVLSVGPKVIGYKFFVGGMKTNKPARQPREDFLKRFRPYKGNLV